MPTLIPIINHHNRQCWYNAITSIPFPHMILHKDSVEIQYSLSFPLYLPIISVYNNHISNKNRVDETDPSQFT